MADIFISYSQSDRERVRLLAAMLEANGYSVWWDTSLLGGESFRRRIMTELGRARAVIVVWTRSSVDSDWVLSEAGRGHANGNLIPVKESGLAYADIPPPFDNMHVEDADRHEKVLAAVVAQLVRPSAGSVGRLTKQVRYQLLTWIGAAGGALTLFTNLGSLLRLSEWARRIIDHWLDWTQAFWTWASALVALHIPIANQVDLTFMLFVLAVAAGSHVSYVLATGDRTLPILKFRYFFGWHVVAAVAWFLLFSTLIAPLINLTLYNWGIRFDYLNFINTFLNFLLVTIFVLLLTYKWPRVSSINTSFALGVIATVFFESAFARDPAAFDVNMARLVPIIALSLACLLVAAPIFFHRRLWLLLLILVMLVVGNEVAKLGLAG